MKKNKIEGQSVVEYLLLFTAVIAVVVMFLTSNSSPYRSSLNTAFSTGIGELNAVANRMHAAPVPGP